MYLQFYHLYKPLLLTHIRKHALIAVRGGAGSTYGAPVVNQTVAEIIAFLRWDYLPKLHLHLFRVFYAIHKAYAV